MATGEPNSTQINFRVSEERLNRLDTSARIFKKTRGQILAELIDHYLEMWEQAEGAKRKVIEFQKAREYDPDKHGKTHTNE